MVAFGSVGGLGWDSESLRITTYGNSSQTDQLMNFPCVFPVKVMGANQDDFENLVVSIIKKHAAIAANEVVTTRLSRGGRFLSLTVHIHAESQDQLDAIYRELSAHERVLMML